MKLQKPSPMPFGKYKSFQDRIALDMRDRTWPDQIITKAPRWLSTDLRDGNQALIDPMTPDRKRKMFDLLVSLGFKEIEVGFPAASQVDFDFVREIIEQDAIPDDVRISVLTQAREDLIERTVESLVGAKKPTVHLYNATAPVFRKVVFGFDGDGFDQTRDIALQGTQAVMKHAETMLSDADFGYQYSPEIFVDTEPEFALDIVGSVLDMWQPAAGRETDLDLLEAELDEQVEHLSFAVRCHRVDERLVAVAQIRAEPAGRLREPLVRPRPVAHVQLDPVVEGPVLVERHGAGLLQIRHRCYSCACVWCV